MNEEEENTGSIFDAIDAAQANSDKELSEQIGRASCRERV